VAFHNLALLLCGKLAQHFSEMLAQLSVQRPAPTLRDKYHVIFAVPRRVAQTFKLVHLVSSFHVLGGSRLEVSTMDNPEYVKLLLPPRQSRGNSLGSQCSALAKGFGDARLFPEVVSTARPVRKATRPPRIVVVKAGRR